MRKPLIWPRCGHMGESGNEDTNYAWIPISSGHEVETNLGLT